MASAKEIERYFGAVPEHALSKLQALCTSHSLSVEDLYAHWEACCFRESKNGQVLVMSTESLGLLTKEITQHATKSRPTTGSGAAAMLDTSFTFDADSLHTMQSGVGGAGAAKRVRIHGTAKRTATQGRAAPSAVGEPLSGMSALAIQSPAPQTEKFTQRTNRGHIEECYNEQLSGMQPAVSASVVQSTIELLEGQQVDAFRYMFDKLNQKATVLDAQIVRTGLTIFEANSLQAWHNPCLPSQEEVTVIGRVCCDSDARLNEASVTLETNVEIGQGARAHLRLDALSSFALFPGQIIGLQGINNTGSYFTATKLFTPPLPPPAKSPLHELREYHMTSDGDAKRPVGLIVAAGPYTLDDSLTFEPLRALLEAIERSKPDLVVLMGPFLDRQHPLLSTGQTDLLPSELFQEHILSPVQDMLARCPGTRLALVPSTDDLLSDYACLPQAPMDVTFGATGQTPGQYTRSTPSSPSTLMCWPNPVQFRINELTVALTSADVLMHISQEEIARAPTHSDRLARLSRHLVEQRSMYPLNPAATGEAVDLAQAAALALHRQPDLLILSSQLHHFCKPLEMSSLCLNPGRLTRKQTGGTYARITVHPFSSELFYTTDANSRLPHKIAERAKVEIIRV